MTPTHLNWKDPDAVDLVEALAPTRIASSLDSKADQKEAMEAAMQAIIHETPDFQTDQLSDKLDDLKPYRRVVFARDEDGSYKYDDKGRRIQIRVHREARPEADAFLQALKEGDHAEIGRIVHAKYMEAMRCCCEDAWELVNQWEQAA